MRCPASCWNILARPGLIPRWRSCTCAWVQARVAARSKAVVSRCLSMRSSSASRDGATTVQKAMCTIAPGGIRTRLRRAKTASSTYRPCSRAAVRRSPRWPFGRCRRGRGTGPCRFPPQAFTRRRYRRQRDVQPRFLARSWLAVSASPKWRRLQPDIRFRRIAWKRLDA